LVSKLDFLSQLVTDTIGHPFIEIKKPMFQRILDSEFKNLDLVIRKAQRQLGLMDERVRLLKTQSEYENMLRLLTDYRQVLN
jgi:hypothetical protein